MVPYSKSFLASHEGDSYEKDQGYPGKTAESDHGCKPDRYFNSYMAAARRFLETHDKVWKPLNLLYFYKNLNFYPINTNLSRVNFF